MLNLELCPLVIAEYADGKIWSGNVVLISCLVQNFIKDNKPGVSSCR